MRKRWINSVIEASQQDVPAMPFHRSVRHAARMTPRRESLKIA